MKVEIHCHTNVFSGCSRIPPNELVAMAEASGYDAMFITDHGKVWSRMQIAGLREMAERVRVFPGIELTLPDGPDLLVLGADDPVYETMTSPSEIFAKACQDGCLTVIAHPFRWSDELPAFCGLADAVEVLTCNHPHEDQAEAARAFAVEHRMAPVYASDAHGVNFMNRFWMETHEPFSTPQEFRRLVVAGRYDNHLRETTDLLPPAFKAASMAELTDEELSSLCVEPLT